MSVIETLLKTLDRVAPNPVNTSSLQFRLTVGVISIFGVGLGGVVLWLNWEMKQLLVLSQLDLSDNYPKLLTDIHHLETISVASIAATTVLSTLFIQRSLLPLQQLNYWMETQTTPLNLSYLNLYRAPSEVQQLAQHWNRLMVCVMESGEQQRQFTSNVAHELRTPLSLVYGYLQRTLRRRSNLTETQCEALEIATSEMQHTIQLLQDLLKLARADSGAISLQLEPLVLNEVLTAVATMTEQFEQRTIHIEASSVVLQVKADRNHLMQILSHLLDHAIRYSEPDMPITLKLSRNHLWAVVQVCDRGCGIPLSQQSNIFEPFYRGDPSRTRATGGAGLGLAIVKSLVTRMGGQITVQSTPSQGSSFILTLPALGEPV